MLIVGLGNPGREYAETPHNLGFQVVDRLAAAHGIRVTKPDSSALAGDGTIEGRPVMLAKPQTFMNLSGTSVRRLMEKHAFSPADLVVIYDDLDLPWGSIRIRPKGSAGGHNGMKSVIAAIGTQEFARVRLGIHPGRPIRDGRDREYVLSPMKREQKQELDELLDTVCRAVESIIVEGVEKSMTRYNRRAQDANTEEQ